MGVDGIDKADIFDEYFDDDKPKITNFEKIKAMDIDVIAKCLNAYVNCDTPCKECLLTKVGIDTFCSINMTGDGLKKWLESEVRE